MLKTEVVILGALLNLVLCKESSLLLRVQVELHLSTNILKTQVVILGALLNLVLCKESSLLLRVLVDLHFRAVRMFCADKQFIVANFQTCCQATVKHVACNILVFISGD